MSDEVKHTPGPWQCTKAKHGIDGGHLVIAEVGPDREDRALVIHAPFGNDGETELNAHLIVAAPELLEALETCERYLVERGVEFKGRTGRTIVLPKIRAAIAKAKGEPTE